MNTTQKAIMIAGGNTAVAVAMGQQHQKVWRWAKKNQFRADLVPKLCEMVAANGGNIQPSDIRPDVFGDAV